MKDVVIIGSGAGGGPLARSLSQSGMDVLVLEKGPRYSRQDYDHDEGLQPRGFTPSLDEDPHTVVTRKTTTPLLTNLGWIASCMGGGTEHMGGYFYRFHPDDFRMKSRFGDFEELADWPYGYEELEPYYVRAEWEIGVAGSAGANPFAGPRSRPYPLPPLDAHPVASKLEEACRGRGLHPFPTPRSINSRPYQDRPPCAYCGVCASYGCPVGARGTSRELLCRAEATGRCEVRTGAMVREITVSRDGQASGCVYLDHEGREQEVRARVVCVSCSAVESARLLLMSKSPRFPDGLANGSGLVGRHLQFHGVTMGWARLPRRKHPEIMRSQHPMVGRSVMDHYFLPEGVSDIAKGGLLRFGRAPERVLTPGEFRSPVEFRPIGSSSTPADTTPADTMPASTAPASTAPASTAPAEPSLRTAPETDHMSVYFEVFHDFIPNAGTWTELETEVRDRWELPVARIHLDLPGHHRRAGGWVMQRAFEIFDDLGAENMVPTDVGGTSAYLVHGTCRAGNDPEKSVLNGFCQAHEVPNLFVVDGSFMPTSGGAAPTLTILANSFRTADHIAARFKS